MDFSSTESDIIRIVRQIYPEAQDVEITTEMTFSDLGLDSLTRIDVLAAAEAHFEIEVPDDVVGTLKTVADLATFVEKVKIG